MSETSTSSPWTTRVDIDGLFIEQYGRDEFVDQHDPEQVDIALAAEGWRRALEIVETADPDMLVLDEINVAVSFGLIPLEEVVSFVSERPERLDLILTGRYAPEELIALSDCVTEMREIRHHYRSGIAMRKGIEY